MVNVYSRNIIEFFACTAYNKRYHYVVKGDKKMKQWKRLCGVALSGVLALSLTVGGMTGTTSEAKAKKAT